VEEGAYSVPALSPVLRLRRAAVIAFGENWGSAFLAIQPKLASSPTITG
jgi:hypothetical protein